MKILQSQEFEKQIKDYNIIHFNYQIFVFLLSNYILLTNKFD